MCEIQRLTQYAFCFHSELRTVASDFNIYISLYIYYVYISTLLDTQPHRHTHKND